MLQGVDLTVAPGEVVAIAGRSGSGKTTLLMIISGWEHADAGSVEVAGTGTSSAPPGWRELAILPQSLGLLDELTIAENVVLPLRLDRNGPDGDADGLMEQLGIAHLAESSPRRGLPGRAATGGSGPGRGRRAAAAGG